jgi:integrase
MPDKGLHMFTGRSERHCRRFRHDGLKFHGLRHGAATLMLAGGVSDAVAIKMMGHADTKILRRYQEVVDELQRDAAARMDRLLGG